MVYHNLRRVWSSGVYQTLIITRRELQVCLVAKEINSKKVTQKNQNNYMRKILASVFQLLFFKLFYSKN